METENTTFNYAGFWKRFAAYTIDMFIVSIGGFVIGFIFGIPYDVLAGKAEFVGFADDYILSFILSFLLVWIYQATLGKMALGIIVTDLSGKRVSFGKATGRYFGQIISGFILGIGFLMIAFTAKKQGFHDKMAGCLVVNKTHSS